MTTSTNNPKVEEIRRSVQSSYAELNQLVAERSGPSRRSNPPGSKPLLPTGVPSCSGSLVQFLKFL